MKNLLRDTDYKETAHCSDAHNIDIQYANKVFQNPAKVKYLDKLKLLSANRLFLS